MAQGAFDTYVFERGQFTPHKDDLKDQMQWLDYLLQQGYSMQSQVWGQYPNAYIKVYEAKADAGAAYKYVAVLNLVCYPHHVFIRDLNGLTQLLQLLLPLFNNTSRPDEDTGDALFGTQGADEQSDDAKE